MTLEHRAAGSHRHAQLTTLAVPDPQAPELALRDWEEVAGTIDPAAYLESLDRELDALERQGDEKIVARRFFSELDREANPILLQGMVRLGRIHREDADQRRITIKIVSNELRERLRLRDLGSDRAAERLAERPIEHLVRRCRYVSQLVLGLIDRYFGEDITAFERAVEQFASGGLRVVLTNGLSTAQPSSSNFLLFREQALMASTLGIEAKRWKALGAALGASHAVFCRVYGSRPPGVGKSLPFPSREPGQ